MLVRVNDPNWRREVESAFPVILPRLTPLLGPDAVRKLVLGPD